MKLKLWEQVGLVALVSFVVEFASLIVVKAADAGLTGSLNLLWWLYR